VLIRHPRPLDELIKSEFQKKKVGTKKAGPKNAGAKGVAKPGNKLGNKPTRTQGTKPAQAGTRQSSTQRGPTKTSTPRTATGAPKKFAPRTGAPQQTGPRRVVASGAAPKRKTFLKPQDNLQVKVVNLKPVHAPRERAAPVPARPPRAERPAPAASRGVTLESLITKHGQIEGRRLWEEIQDVLNGNASIAPRVTVRNEASPARVSVRPYAHGPFSLFSDSDDSVMQYEKSAPTADGSSSTSLNSLFGSIAKSSNY